MKFKDKIVLVTGGTGGLGRAVSLAFLAEGAKVIVTFRDQHELDDLKGAAGSNSASLQAELTDVTDEAAVQQLLDKIGNEHGRLDALVNTVGAYVGGVNMWDLDSKTFERLLTLNLRSGFNLSRAAARQMLKQGHGSIVNVAAKAALDHGAGASAYAASKAAALAMIDSLGAELKGTAVRANSILPSIIDTAINRKFMPGANFATWPKPEQIAKVILFLCSDDAEVIQGAAIPVYGNS
jgi:NAD(P)-dependent dehydrogenase (short-subunit alcohol dehydrogenase family)